MENRLYPPSPAGKGPEQLTVPLTFRREVSKVIGSITLFIIVYLLLVTAAIGLAVVSCYFGGLIMISMPNFATLTLGLGLICLGISVIVFLLKFLFAVSRDENPARVPITEKEQPELFAFIRRLSKETNTAFPKKIYVSPDVNACVFYNSGFWSMFLPVRKNLEIGLGLVNSINISEFKAVIAHEFGHFSQRSMKLGSYTYNVNKVIHNMLYENNSYTNFLNSWARLGSFLRFFALATVKIAAGIQWILRGMYTFINRNYLSLSREMEFHADAISASVSGGNNLVSALSRTELAGNCYNTALNKATDRLREKRVSRNIFFNQLTIFRSVAAEHQLGLKEGIPEVSYQFLRSFSRSRINYRNQWASHPTLEERKAHLDRLGIETVPDDNPVWLLFRDPEQLQEKMTARLYKDLPDKETMQLYDGKDFESWYAAQLNTYTLPPVYKGFYDSRYIIFRDWDPSTLEATAPALTFDDLFNEETGKLQSAIENNRSDVEIVKAISEKKIDVTSFDFDGVKYGRNDCGSVISILEKDISLQEARQQSLEKDAFLFFLRRAANKELIRDYYKAYRSISIQYEDYVDLVNKVLQTIHPFYAGGLTLDQVNAIVRTIKLEHEPALKAAYRRFMEDGPLHPEKNVELCDKIKEFSGKNYFYFVRNEFQNNELEELRSLAIELAGVLNGYRFETYKRMLEGQLAS